jgi:hypothetical protein
VRRQWIANPSERVEHPARWVCFVLVILFGMADLKIRSEKAKDCKSFGAA